jgi:hypothetical protein
MSRKYRITRLLLVPVLLAGLQACGREITAPVGDVPVFGQSGTLAPTITAIDPGAAAPGTTLDVRVFGSGFEPGAALAFVRSGGRSGHVRTNSTRFVSSTELVANVTVANDADADLYSVEASFAGPRKKGVGADLFAVTLEASTADAEPSSAVNGHGRYTVSGNQWTSSFNAKTAPDGTVGGNFRHSNASSDMRGSVTCLTIVGTEAWLAGVIDHAAGPWLEGQAVGWVAVDNGQGANALPDQMGAPVLLDIGASDFCASPLVIQATNLESGNVQLRR